MTLFTKRSISIALAISASELMAACDSIDSNTTQPISSAPTPQSAQSLSFSVLVAHSI